MTWDECIAHFDEVKHVRFEESYTDMWKCNECAEIMGAVPATYLQVEQEEQNTIRAQQLADTFNL